ncbi:MAG: hypothetical protein RLY97_61 [Pseudomonadota bacterium]|jgi:hypothetical protein
MFEGQHYQNAYITPDIEAAIASFAARAPIGDVRIFDIAQTLQLPSGAKKLATRLAFIWIDNLQYELIQVVEDETGVYSGYTSNGGIMHFHHICMRVSGDWDSFRARIAAQNFPVVLERAIAGDELKYLYIDAREMCGHYIEYCWMTDARWDMMRAM